MIRLGITLGDPSGIGPELVTRVLAATPPDLRQGVRVYGDHGVLERASNLPLDSLGVEIVPVTRLAAGDAVPGRPTPAGGAAQAAYLEAAVEDARKGVLDALVTAPIAKKQVQAAGFAFPGHTEFLAERLGPPGRPCDHAMMFAGPRLRVVLATIHLPLSQVPVRLSALDVARAIVLGGEALVRDFGVKHPRIGVLGLNPHAGEGGLFGHEEADVIVPGVAEGQRRLAALGLAATVNGPLIPDAAFRLPDTGPAYDLFVAMYHDQGLIPVKLIDFEESVNVTLGLPIVRTSPDHGVAYDIAGKRVARVTSFAAAFALAHTLAARRRFTGA